MNQPTQPAELKTFWLSERRWFNGSLSGGGSETSALTVKTPIGEYPEFMQCCLGQFTCELTGLDRARLIGLLSPRDLKRDLYEALEAPIPEWLSLLTSGTSDNSELASMMMRINDAKTYEELKEVSEFATFQRIMGGSPSPLQRVLLETLRSIEPSRGSISNESRVELLRPYFALLGYDLRLQRNTY